MTEERLREALRGLFAYDTGSTDSGIHDEGLRQQCIAAIKAIPTDPYEVAPRLWLSRLIRDAYLSEEALEEGYGIEDAISFVKWLQERMDLPEVL